MREENMIKLIQERKEFLKWRDALPSCGKIGLVPTMGNLHRGHLHLVQMALKEGQYIIVTIFVNPKQFGPHEDFNSYPRTLSEDIQKLSRLEHGERITVFAPLSQSEIYPFNYQTEIKVNTLDKVLCGKYRKGHFSGVTTVVYQLFALARPDFACFGQKDYQQFKIIERMSLDLMLPLKLMMAPIIRESDGLALSSRNQFISGDQRAEATKLKNSLQDIAKAYRQGGRDHALALCDTIVKNDQRFQYLEIVNAADLSQKIPSQLKESGEVLVAGAFFLGDTRLIDNLIL